MDIDMILGRQMQLHRDLVVFEKLAFDKLHFGPIRWPILTTYRNMIPATIARSLYEQRLPVDRRGNAKAPARLIAERAMRLAGVDAIGIKEMEVSHLTNSHAEPTLGASCGAPLIILISRISRTASHSFLLQRPRSPPVRLRPPALPRRGHSVLLQFRRCPL